MKTLVTLIITVLTLSSFAQNKVLFLNGDTMSIGTFKVDTSKYIVEYKNKRNKIKTIDIDNVFSIVDSTGKETVYYIPVAIDEDSSIVSVEEMREFITGAFDANHEHKARLAFGAGLVSGVAGAAVTAPGMLFYSPIVPAGVSVLTGFTQPSKSKVIKLHPDKKDEKYYIRGYQESAKSKRTNNAIKGGLLGLLLGISGILIYSATQ